jgi:hypothetical protein
MRLPSIQYLAGEARSAAARFPAVVAAALAAAAFGLFAVGHTSDDTLVRGIAAAQLGVPLFFALGAAGETGRWSRGLRGVLVVVVAAALVAYYFSLPDRMRPGAVTRFIQFNLAAHLLVAFLPFARPGRANGFWQYNKSLFLRFLVSALFSVVVYLGLAVAMVAIDKLLGLRIHEHAYARLWVVVAFVLNTWMFLGGVPRDLNRLEERSDYPRGLKVFAQYILIPLVVVYLTILTIYLVKVIVTTEWPSGWIGYLVSSVAVVGILALLLVWPVAGRHENRWVATYTRWFFIFMIPAIVMLLLAIYKRIDQYGVTENRYFLAVLSVWLAGVAVYFIVTRGRSIKVIPSTLCAVALVTSFGPWGAYTVARHSQTARLEALMDDYGIVEDGAIAATNETIPVEDQREISSITLYLVEHHGVETFERWMTPERIAGLGEADLPEEVRTSDRQLTYAIVKAMGFDFVPPWSGRAAPPGQFRYRVHRYRGGNRALKLDRPDYRVHIESLTDAIALDGSGYSLGWDKIDGFVVSDSAGVVVAAPVAALLEELERAPGYNIDAVPRESLRLVRENQRARLVVYIEHISGTVRDGERVVTDLSAECYVTLR